MSCRLSHTHIIICTSRKLYLYRHTHTAITKVAVYETALNPSGICALGDRVCVFPGRSEGQIQILRLPERTKDGEETSRLSVSIVAAHESALRAICLSPDETIVASASVTVRLPFDLGLFCWNYSLSIPGNPHPSPHHARSIRPTA